MDAHVDAFKRCQRHFKSGRNGKALDVMAENSGMLPRNLDVEEMRRDLDAHDALNARMVR